MSPPANNVIQLSAKANLALPAHAVQIRSKAVQSCQSRVVVMEHRLGASVAILEGVLAYHEKLLAGSPEGTSAEVKLLIDQAHATLAEIRLHLNTAAMAPT